MSTDVNIFKEIIKKFFSNEKRIIAYKLIGLLSIGFFILIIMLYTLQKEKSFFDYVYENIPYFIYFPILLLLFIEVKLLTPGQNKELSDIDEESKYRTINIVNNNGNITVESSKNSKLTPNEASSDFSSYFINIINYLENKSIDSDRKASLLLDNGKRFSGLGILFFIVATIIWQFHINYVGKFETHHIYGIVSTSLVFIFIEFLSAWYLRQYKSFSDTSTYLTKIKSIFDKYMLIYLVSVEKGDRDFSILLEQLSSEIKWPETYLLKNADVSFAKDALETMTTMAQAFKKEVKNNPSEN
ncbi:hypothetical protein [Acinetobacter haemolyticus]|uniref:hypothetical protein n=1 Tax=Acinetobacter haemolyticus TaxID=29430 RepID=UPI000DEA6DE0|nr:hypothetical protein [Acinetobacter haemolyticus]WHR57595.1 hypothetical protein PGW89_14430 [Acinetobacter haemolyticus]